MLKHIVMWKFMDAEGKTKDEILEKITTKAPTFNELINEIKEIDDGKEIIFTLY